MPFRFQFGGPPQIVMVIRVAAVDDRILAVQERDEGRQRRIDRGRWHHHPDIARRVQLPDEILKRCRSPCSFLDERLHGFRVDVVNDAGVTGPKQSSHHIGTHPAQTDHAKLHCCSPRVLGWQACLFWPRWKPLPTWRSRPPGVKVNSWPDLMLRLRQGFPLIFVRAAPLCMARWSVLSLSIKYCGSSLEA